MLVLKPKGSGNWTATTLRIDGRLGPLDIRVGSVIELGGIVFRVCKVLP